MNSKSSIWFTLNSIINYLSGIGYCFTLILIPLGIYCFICATRNSEFSKMSDAQLVAVKDKVSGWAIFSAIVNFPIGLIALIPLTQIGDNGIKVTTVDEKKEETTQTQSEVKSEAKPVVETEPEKKTDVKMENSEIDDKINRLTEFKKEGLISKEEYERAVAELKSKKN